MSEYNRSAYQQNVSQPEQPKQFTTRDIMAGVYQMAQYDMAGAQQEMQKFQSAQTNPQSQWYDPYTQPTNRAVSNLASYGFDTNNLNDDWFNRNNGWIASNLVYNGTTNSPSKPGKKATKDQLVAYELYQYQKSEEATRKAEQQWNALQQELTYLAQDKARNYSDEDIMKMIDWSKYKELTSMDENKYYQPNEYNRAIGYSKDAMYGVLWEARNPEYNGDIYGAMANSVLGNGNVWQDDPEITAKLNWNDANTYAPYSVGMTAGEEGRYFGVYGFGDKEIEMLQNRLDPRTGEPLDPNDATAMKMRDSVLSAYETTTQAKTELGAFQRALDKKLENVKDPEKAAKIVEDLLNSEVYDKDTKESITFNTLKKMDASLDASPDSLLKTTDAIDYRKQDMVKYAMDVINANAGKETGTDVQDSIADYQGGASGGGPEEGVVPAVAKTSETEASIATAQDAELADVKDAVYEGAGEMEKAVMDNGWSVTYDGVKNAWDNIVNYGRTFVNNLSAKVKDGVLSDHTNDTLSSLQSMYDYDMNEEKIQNMELQLDELQHKYGDAILLVQEPESEVSKTITIDGENFQIHLSNAYSEDGAYILDAADQIYNGDPYGVRDEETLNKILASDEYRKAIDEENAKIQAIANSKDSGNAEYSEEYLQEVKAAAEQMRSLELQIEDAKLTNAQNEQTYQKDQKAFDTAQRKLEQQIYVLGMLGMDTSDLEEYQDTIAYLTNFNDYEATVWSAYNPNDAYRIALAEGEDRDAVYEAAKKGNDQVVAELETAKARKQYIEDHNLNVPANYLSNLDRHIAKLERDARDYEDFLLSKNDDWDEMVAKGRQEEYESRPQQWSLIHNPELDWSQEEYYAHMDEDAYDELSAFASHGLRDLAGVFTKQMTQEEKDTYYYLMGIGDKKRAQEYVSSLMDMSYGVLHTRFTNEVREMTEGMLREQKSQDFATKEEADKWVNENGKKFSDYQVTKDENGYHISWSQSTGAGAFVGTNILAVLAAPGAAMASLGYMGYSMITGNEINPDNAILMANTFRSTTREQSAKEIADYYGEGTFAQKAVQMFYEMVSNRLDSAMMGGTFGGLSGGIGNEMLQEFLGASPMGISAAMDAMMEAKRKGASDAQAWGVGAVTFLAETGTEAISLDNMKKAFKIGEDVTGEGMKAFLKQWLTQGGVSEMLGESANDIIENLADEAIMGELSDHSDRVWSYRMQGYGKEDAEAMARRDEVAGVLRTAFMSYLSPGLDVASYAVGRADYYRQKTRQLQQAGINTSTIQVAKAEREARIEEQRAADAALNDELGSFDLEAVDEELARREARDREAEIAENGVENGEGKFTFVGGEPAFQQEDADIDVSQLQSKTNPEQTATPAESAKVDTGTQYNALESVKNADASSQSATIASVLDTAKTEESADIANAATMKLGEMLGENANPAEFVQDMLLGADVEGVDAGQVMQAIQYASLGGENSAAWQLMQTEEFKNADYGEQAAMLAETVETDSANQALGQQMQSAVHDYLVVQAEKEILKNGVMDSVKQAQEKAAQAVRNVQMAQESLEEKQGELQAKADALQAATEEFNQNPTADNQHMVDRALNEYNKADIVEKEYQQHLDNVQRANEEAKANAKSVQEAAFRDLRQQAEAAVADQMQQRQERLAQEAEQQRIAEEQAAQAQAEEDERSGKKAEVDTQNLAEGWADQMHLKGEEREAFIQRVVERQEHKSLGKIDMTGKVSNAEGYLAINAFARKTGLNFQLSDTLPEGTRGMYENGTVYLNANLVRNGQMTVGQALVEASLHEVTHSMEDSKNYKTYRNVVLESMFGAKGTADELYAENAKYRAAVDQKIADYKKIGQELSVQKAEQEIVADFARLNLAEKDVIQRFMDAGLGGKMRNTLHNINQAMKNFFGQLRGEDRTAAEYLRRAERAYQKALDDVAKTAVHPEGGQFSVAQIAQATGMTFDADTLKLYDQNGNEVDGVKNKITPDMIGNTPAGLLIRNGLSEETQGKAMDMMAGLMNMVARYKDSNLVWEIGATTLSSTFSALKSNSDPQYKTTVDFGTVCAKTQAIIDVMSQVMLDRVKAGKTGGLDRQEIMKVYNEVNKAGLSVPCPVCYVFSRWMGVPSLLGQMSQYQNDYVVTKKGADGKVLLDKNGNAVIDVEATQKLVDNYIKTAEEQYGDAKAINNAKTKLQTKNAALEEKRIELEGKLYDKSLTAEQKKDIQNQIDATLSEMTENDKKLGEVRAYNWITQALCKKSNGKFVIDSKFKLTPDEILFDLNRTGEFAEYEKNWTYRNTRGAGMGKAIMPYSGETIGDILYGTGTGKKRFRQSAIKNPWLNMDDKAAARQLRSARNRARQQNLVGGQRLQSTSDFRPEWGLDYIMSFLELQAAGSKVQMYTKVAEAVDFFASVGADVNLSIMGQGQGWHVDENGNKVLDFSSITGMDYETAKALKEKYDNVQMILVGMNDDHIRLAIASDDIDFVIPWHSSGNSQDTLKKLIGSLGEKLEAGTDYSTTQTDSVSANRTAEQKSLWDARVKLLRFGGDSLTQAEREALLSNPITKDLYERFTVEGKDPDCYGVTLVKEQAEQIFPYEYWNTSLTKEHADENGKRFVEYCEAMGIVPRFSQFKDDPGYWKLLIDRPMYNNDGTYHQQSVINVTNAQIGELNEAGELTGSDLPQHAQAKYAPKDPRNANYEKYTKAEQDAIENAEAAIDGTAKYDDGSEGQYSVYGDMTDADIDQALAQSDQDYMSAVERGDMETAQADVDQAAEQAGYTIKAYHGTRNNFTSFDEGKIGNNYRGYSKYGKGFYFSSSEETANYWGNNQNVLGTYLKMENPYTLPLVVSEGPLLDEYNRLRIKKNKKNAPVTSEAGGYLVEMLNDLTNDKGYSTDFLKGLGYDGIIINHLEGTEGTQTAWSGTTEYVVFDSNQIKSSDPVTYDDNGNPIPLSERFNQQNPDIRYSIGGEITDADIDQRLADAGVIPQLSTDNEGNLPGMPVDEGGSKQRQFGRKTAQESDALHDDVKEYLYNHSEYTPDTNRAQIDRSIDWVRSHANQADPDGFFGAMQEAQNGNFDSISADGQARMLTLMGMAALKGEQTGDHSSELMLADLFNKQGTEAGRALQARKMFRLMTPVGRMATLNRMADQINDEYGRKANEHRVHLSQWLLDAAAVAESEEDFQKVQKAAAAELASQMPANWKEKFTAIRMLSMLGNPRTHIRNLVGNLAFMPAVGLKNKIGASLEKAFVKEGDRTKTLGLATPESRAFAKRYAKEIESVLRGESKYNEGGAVQQERKIFGQGKGVLSKTLGKATQFLVDANGNALETEDWIFLNRHFRNALAGYMTANGLTEADMKGNTLDKATEYAVNEAHKATYRDANEVANWMNNIKNPAAKFIINAVLPFKKTPMNILKRGVEYSPVSIIRSLTSDAKHLKQWQAYQNGELSVLPEKAISPSQYIDRLSSGLSGSAFVALGALLSSLGFLKGGMDDDDDELDKLNGSQEYSLEIGGVSFTIDWAAPICMPLFVGATVMDEAKKAAAGKGKGVSIGSVLDSLLGIAEPVTQLSMLDGLNSVLNPSNYGDTDSLVQVGEKIVTNYATSYVPTILGQVARTIDTTRRRNFVESGADLKVFRSALEQVENKIPFLTQKNIPYRNVWGEADVSPTGWAAIENFLSPGYGNTLKNDPVTNELKRIYEATGNPSMIPKAAGKTVTINGKNTPLNAEQYDQYVVDRGQTAYNAIQSLMESPVWQICDDNTRAMMITDAWSYANQIGRHNVDSRIKKDSWVANAEHNGNFVDVAIERAADSNRKEYIKGYGQTMAEALDSNDSEMFDLSVTALEEAGATESEIRGSLRDYFKPLYQVAFEEHDDNTMELIEEKLLDAGVGFKGKDFAGWIPSEADEIEIDQRWLNMGTDNR